MNKNLNNFQNLCNINIKNKKSSFLMKNNLLNKQIKSKLILMKNNNLLNLKQNYNNIQINFKFFENKFILKNIHKWK